MSDWKERKDRGKKAANEMQKKGQEKRGNEEQIT
jgi:hypothetical protein